MSSTEGIAEAAERLERKQIENLTFSLRGHTLEEGMKN
jgi:hypothetical protein